MKKWIAVIVFIVVSVPVLLHAQRQEEVTDTVLHPYTGVDTDTVVEEVAPVAIDPAEEDGEEGEKIEEKKPVYFLPNDIPGLTPDSISVRRVNDSAKDALRNDEDFWYANMVFKKNKPVEEEDKQYRPFFATKTFETILWILIIGGFVAFLVLYLANSNISLFRKSVTIKDNEEQGLDTRDIFGINYQKEIDKAVAAGDLRLAVRLMYLQLLRNLADKNLIRYAQGKTNFDYLSQTRQMPWYKHFFRLTRHYEYVWYGLFEPDGEKFRLIRDDFSDFERQLR